MSLPSAWRYLSSKFHRKPSPPQPGDLDGFNRYIDSRCRSYIYKHSIPTLSISLVHGDKTLLTKGYGFEADTMFKQANERRNRQEDLDGNARYEIGSITKLFTTFSLLKLVDEGKVILHHFI